MSRTVQIRGDSAVFPGDACVHCLRPSADTVVLISVRRRTLRRVSVPMCDECIALRQSKSPAQLQFERTATVVSFSLAWVAGIWTYTSVLSWDAVSHSTAWPWAALLGALAVEIAFGAQYLIVRPWSRHFRSPEIRSVLASVVIRDFDWETTALSFADDEYADRFARVNQVADAGQPVAGTVLGV